MKRSQVRSGAKTSSTIPDLPIIERLPLTALRPNSRNARTHSRKQIRLLQSSIRAFGQTKPVIADDNNTILAGHGFVEAARLAV
jgi:ParB-like chromosome segregation protein Spo0J